MLYMLSSIQIGKSLGPLPLKRRTNSFFLKQSRGVSGRETGRSNRKDDIKYINGITALFERALGLGV